MSVSKPVNGQGIATYSFGTVGNNMMSRSTILEIEPAADVRAGPPAVARRAGAAPCRISVGSRIADVGLVWPTTDDMKGALCHVFQCADILSVWIETVAAKRGIEPALVVVSDDCGRPMMMLPFGIERRGGLRVLKFLDANISDYNAPVLFAATPSWSQTDFAQLWQRIVSALPPFDLVQLEKMPAQVGCKANPLLLLEARAWPVQCHSASLPADWSGFASSRIKAPSRHLRYYRNLQKQGPVTYEPARTAEEGARLVDVLMAQKARRFVETRVPGFESEPGMEDFYRAATARFLECGTVVVAAVKSAGEIIAVQWALRHGQRYYYLISGYETGQWEKFSPGRILNEAMLRWCIENGVKTADFGIGDETYKFEYCDIHTPLFEVVQPSTVRGRCHMAAHRVLARLRQTKVWQAARPYKWVVRRALWRNA